MKFRLGVSKTWLLILILLFWKTPVLVLNTEVSVGAVHLKNQPIGLTISGIPYIVLLNN